MENESQVHDYMVSQPDINEKMRAILVDWLIEVHNKFDLMPETLYLTVNLVDRFLAVKMVPRREMQLLGISAMLIACKYEEIWAPEVDDFVCISDRVYTDEQILRMEKIILHHLEWELTVPTCYVFLVRFIKASIPDNEMEKNLVYFLAELSLMQCATIIYCPSMIAASAVLVARHTLSRSPLWTEMLELHTGYSESQLMDCAKMLVTLHSAAAENKLQVVYTKYLKNERGAVAQISPAKALLAAEAAVPAAAAAGSSS
ncbi:G2/mitotic-specific cyclin S13-7 [Dionaea muscipula]